MKKEIISLIALIFSITSVSNGTYAQETNSFTDIRDGHVYKTVIIGNQHWMAENLAYKVNTGFWTYDNDKNKVAKYGYLYDLQTAKNICPSGWHLPSDAEWTTLTKYLGGESVAGGEMKQTGTTYWNIPNTGATNSSGFSALPGGHRTNYYGSFNGLGYYCYFWSATESSSSNAWYRLFHYYTSSVIRDFYFNGYGLSVRCLKD